MNTHKLLEKNIAVGIIVLFFAMSIIPSAEVGAIKTEKCAYAKDTYSGFHMVLNADPLVYPVFYGYKGKNGWYISSVWISFVFDPDIVAEIYYAIDGEDWTLYTGQFEFSEDGEHMLEFYWFDKEGGDPIYGPVTVFKIDQTPPTIKLTKKVGTNKITFTAATTDGVSGVERVEFFLDDDLEETDYDAPYEYIWTGTGIHIVYAVGYNYAGLSIESEKLDTTSRGRSFYFQFINNFFQRIHHIIFWI